MNTGLIVIVLVASAFALFYLSRKISHSTMDPEAAKQQLAEEPGVIIDVRTPQEYAEGHLQKTDHNLNVMSNDFEQKLASLDKNQTYYLYCRSGNRSGRAAGIMKQNGFQNVFNIGAYKDLVNAGLESSK